jgi:uncharacterized membrane protein YeaQ/YmgE (transglycosylase-associated protein family)
METVFKWILWWLLMALVMGWMARTRLKKRTSSEANSLRHPRSTLVMGIVIGGFFLAIAIMSYLFPNNTGSLGISLFFLALALLGAWLVLEYFRARHEIEPGGLRYQKLFGGGGRLRWSEVESVRYSSSAKWFRILTVTGETVRLSAMLQGLPEFAEAVLKEVPEDRIDGEAIPILEQTAAGSPPSIWG